MTRPRSDISDDFSSEDIGLAAMLEPARTIAERVRKALAIPKYAFIKRSPEPSIAYFGDPYLAHLVHPEDDTVFDIPRREKREPETGGLLGRLVSRALARYHSTPFYRDRHPEPANVGFR